MAATTPEQLVAALALYKEVTAATDILPDFREAMQRAITRLIDPQASDRRRGSISSSSSISSISSSDDSGGGGDDEDCSVDGSVEGGKWRRRGRVGRGRAEAV